MTLLLYSYKIYVSDQAIICSSHFSVNILSFVKNSGARTSMFFVRDE